MSKPVTVTLVRDHTHAGKLYPAGSKLPVSAPVRDWMAAQKLISNEADAQQEDKKDAK